MEDKQVHTAKEMLGLHFCLLLIEALLICSQPLKFEYCENKASSMLLLSCLYSI